MEQPIEVVVTLEDYRKAFASIPAAIRDDRDVYCDSSNCPGAQMAKRVLGMDDIEYAHGEIFRRHEDLSIEIIAFHSPAFCSPQFYELQDGKEHHGTLTKI